MALYHIHRPQTFSDIVGQAHITTTLENQVKNAKTAHAYLFSGPRGVGKTTTARILAKSLNCENKKDGDTEPCNTCTTCEEISNSSSIDVMEIDAASHTGVDNVRQNIIENAQFKPTKSKYKIFIIDEVHMLSTAAFNALLKTLEEPPEYVMFILATTDPHKLPATIISRCQRFGFTKVADDEMKKHLKSIAKKEGIKVDDEVIQRIVRKGEGCARDGISLLDQIMASGEKNITTETASLVLPTTNIELQLDFTGYLLNKNQKEGLEFIDRLVEDGISLPHFTTELIGFLRTLMIATVDSKLAQNELDLNKDAQKQMTSLTALTSQSEMILLIDLALKRSGEIKTSPLPQLPLEMLLIEWCAGGSNDKKREAEETVRTGRDLSPQDTKEDISTKQVRTGLDLSQQETNEVPSPEKTTIKEKVKNIITKSTISKEDIEQNWSACIGKIETEMPSLSFIIKMAELGETEGNTINFSVQYSFHKEKIMDKMIKPKIEQMLSEVLETKVKINVDVKEKDESKEANPELQDLASALGGEVIN
ncbi:DNA polymerase III subunit gamma/tau [Candidatus Parcubacteria bacterium]|jgi:DNA polymerase III subunit gamma/tau|nr:DNA polymerase III subunit gamma/tau [Candidatus Parcubacteria bacterium]MBT3948868.1 DNA polymerase III subunit gamma/tau [Candidatus Parcubacteria bacterium]